MPNESDKIKRSVDKRDQAIPPLDQPPLPVPPQNLPPVLVPPLPIPVPIDPSDARRAEQARRRIEENINDRPKPRREVAPLPRFVGTTAPVTTPSQT